MILSAFLMLIMLITQAHGIRIIWNLEYRCQGNTIISVTRPPTKIKQEREKRERERNREKRGLAQWF